MSNENKPDATERFARGCLVVVVLVCSLGFVGFVCGLFVVTFNWGLR